MNWDMNSGRGVGGGGGVGGGVGLLGGGGGEGDFGLWTQREMGSDSFLLI